MKFKYVNPNDKIRKEVLALYKKSQAFAAIQNLKVEDVFIEALNEIRNKDYKRYEKYIQIMYLDYEVHLAYNDEEDVTYVKNPLDEENNDDVVDELEEMPVDEQEEMEEVSEDEPTIEEALKGVINKDDLVAVVSDDKYILSDMASTLAVREIDLAHVYDCMSHLDSSTIDTLRMVYPGFIYDFIEFAFPFIIGKIHSNLANNEFTKEVSAKSVAIVDILQAVKQSNYEQYYQMLSYYLEIYYKNKKYGMEFLDTIITKKERTLIRTLDAEKIEEAITFLNEDDDLLETIINVYSLYYFGDDRAKNEIDKYFSSKDKSEKLRLIFRKGKKKDGNN